jgi:hypothetical protein
MGSKRRDFLMRGHGFTGNIIRSEALKKAGLPWCGRVADILKSLKMRGKIVLRYLGIILGALSVLLRYFFIADPVFAEIWYSRFFFQFVRKVLDLTFGQLPFAGIYFLAVILLSVVIAFLRGLWRKPAPITWKSVAFLRGVGNFSGYVLFMFYVLWGYNYNRIPVEKQLGLDIVPLGKVEIEQRLVGLTQELAAMRAALPAGGITAGRIGPGMEQELRRVVEKVLSGHGFPVEGRVRARWMRPEGTFLRFSTAGLYLPFTGEGHVDPGLAPLQWPAVMAHELSHGYGFGDEGVCSFWALLACRTSKNPYIRYAGAMSYWRSLAAAYREYDPAAFARLREGLPLAVKGDLEDIRRAMQRFPDWVPRLQYKVYDAYLKSQGIGEGMLNYDRVLLLMSAYEKKKAGIQPPDLRVWE